MFFFLLTDKIIKKSYSFELTELNTYIDTADYFNS